MIYTPEQVEMLKHLTNAANEICASFNYDLIGECEYTDNLKKMACDLYKTASLFANYFIYGEQPED